MNTPDINEYSYLWDGSEPGWVLLTTGKILGEKPSFLPFNTITKLALIMEDGDEAALVEQAMLNAGCSVIIREPSPMPDKWRGKRRKKLEGSTE